MSKSDTNLGKTLRQTLQHHFCKTFADDMQAAARAVVGRLFAEIKQLAKDCNYRSVSADIC